MIKIAVCDDEKVMLLDLVNKIETYMTENHYEYQLSTYLEVEALMNHSESFDLIFLDIQMGAISGMEAAHRLRERGQESFIVFVTVLKEYVYSAFEVEASDYLLKPVTYDRLARTLARILEDIEQRAVKSLIIKKEMAFKSIRFKDILYCEAINRKIFVHTKQGIIDYYFKIGVLEKQLGPSFFRCHRSYLVHLKYVCGYENGMAELENGESIPVSRLRQQAFTEVVLNYMKVGRD